MLFTVCPLIVLGLDAFCTLYQTIRPRKTARKSPPMASGRTGTSRAGFALVAVRRRAPARPPGLAPDAGEGLVGVFERGVFFAEGTSFRIVRIPLSFLVPPGRPCAPAWQGPNP
jgi:hypothetical protein